jgi:hypothetical protein
MEGGESVRREPEYSVSRDFFEKALLAVNHATRPFDLNFGKKMRIVIDYDPHEQHVKFYFLKEGEPVPPE